MRVVIARRSEATTKQSHKIIYEIASSGACGALLAMTLLLLAMTASLPLHAQITSLKSGSEKEIIESIDAAVKKKARDDKTKSALAELLTDPNSPVLVKERSAWALGQLEIKSQSKNLAKAAQSKSLLVRSAALDALIRMRASSALQLFIQIAKSDPVFSLRIKAIMGLGLLKKAEAIPTLVQLAGEKKEEIRGVTALAMAALQSTKNDFREALDFLGKDQSSYVQMRAEVGKNIASKNTAEVTMNLKSSDPMIRLFAAQYFHYHGSQKDLKTLQSALGEEKDENVKFELELAAKGIKNRARQAEKKKAEEKKKTAQ